MYLYLLASLGLSCLAMICMTGCGGCDPQPSDASASRPDPKQDPAAGSKRAAENLRPLKKKKPDYEIGAVRTQLSPRWDGQALANDNFLVRDEFEIADDYATSEDAASMRLYKPGHWTATVQSMKSNDHDFLGRVTMTLMAAGNRPLAWDHTPFSLHFSRPVALAQGRKKWVEGQVLMPQKLVKARLHWTLQQRDSLTSVRQQTLPPLVRMPPNQYFLAVLAKEPGRYGYLRVADAVRAPWEDEQGGISTRHYQVLLLDATRSLPLPANMLDWTSLAVVVWDQIDPDRLTPDQQQALVDWLHWGGRLVISGPGSLATLRGSFLDPYLPATSTETVSITREALPGWNAYWALPSHPTATTSTRGDSKFDQSQADPSRATRSQASLSQRGAVSDSGKLLPTVPWPAIVLKPRPQGQEVPGTDHLFYQRRIGQGTLLVSAISLTVGDLVNWSGFDSFLNGALLGRPRRHFTEGPYGGVCVGWQDYPNRRLDSHFTTGMRIFARDWGAAADRALCVPALSSPGGTPLRTTASGSGAQLLPRPRGEPPGAAGRPGGMGSWSEFGAVSRAARSALREAAGVRVPAASFVVVCLAVYLVVLVPLNWMVFRTLGHVEWAWMAAPVIALLGTLVVVRQAQLDIGFVRAQTELGVLELTGDYPRGHLSRYTALYTSLSTTYNVRFDNPGAVATPFPARRNDPTLRGQPVVAVNLNFQQHVEMQGLAIASATTRMVHSEQMVELQGPLEWRKSSRGYPQVVNRTGFDLDDCLLVRRRIHGKPPLTVCWLGRLRSGQSAPVSFRPLPMPGTPPADGQLPYAPERARAAQRTAPPRLNIDPLLKLACGWDTADDPWHGARDAIRLLARIDKRLPGCKISPRASQVRAANLVIAHLAYGDSQNPRPDTNSRFDLTGKQP